MAPPHDDVAIELRLPILLSVGELRRCNALLCAGCYTAVFRLLGVCSIDLEARTIEFLVDGGFVSRGDFILMTMGGARARRANRHDEDTACA